MDLHLKITIHKPYLIKHNNVALITATRGCAHGGGGMFSNVNLELFSLLMAIGDSAASLDMLITESRLGGILSLTRSSFFASAKLFTLFLDPAARRNSSSANDERGRHSSH